MLWSDGRSELTEGRATSFFVTQDLYELGDLLVTKIHKE